MRPIRSWTGRVSGGTAVPITAVRGGRQSRVQVTREHTYTCPLRIGRMGSRIGVAITRAKYAAVFAALGAALGGMVNRQAASTGGAIGGLLGATLGEACASGTVVGGLTDRFGNEDSG